MKRLFISQPMNGLTDEEILATRERLHKQAENYLGEKLILIDSFMEDYPGEINKHIPVWYLAKSIELLSTADVVYFGKGWEDARGCNIEYKISQAYGITTITEEEL